MKKKLIFAFIVSLSFSCEKETQWAIQDNGNHYIVVNGIITDEYKYQSIQLSYPVNSLNTSPRPVTGAAVIISDEDSSYILTERIANSGVYFSDRKFAGRPEKNHSLIINVYNKVYSAKAYMVMCKPFTEFRYSKNDEDNLYHVDWVASVFNSDKPAMWELLIDWSHVTGYENTDTSKCKARMLFYTLPTLDVSEIFAPEMEIISFPAGATVTEKKYSLTPEHAEFIREILSITNWRGGLFDTAPANITTNMSSGAVGYFGACAVLSITTTISP